jgi:Uma2 family endonuclease
MEIVKERSTVVRKNRASKKPTTVAEFEKWEAKRNSDTNYEFYYGEIIKKPGMKQLEFSIIQFLTRCFATTNAYKNYGELWLECDVYIDEFRKRIPDLAYFTKEQIAATSKGEKVVSAFAIEILSPSESLVDIETKLRDYFDAGVKLVWYVLPKTKKIYAYTALNKIEIFIEGQKIIANPVLPDFEIDIEQLFAPII